jgi:formate dehydrogenase/NADH-quinone oxidoreductase subunit F
VSCLGRCDIAPAVAVNERPAPVADADDLVDAAKGSGVGDAAAATRTEPWPNDPYPAGSGVEDRYATLRALLAGKLDADEIVSMLKDSGLRGMGGAGFPTGQKWGLVRDAQPGSTKYAIVNADESEPGTFKDRQILAQQPHLVLEGLLLGMAVVGAEEGWVFIRHEYGPEEHVLRKEIDALRAAGVVGPDACGSGRRLSVDIFVSPGGYILGEETALLECMEGHRGEPRNKPPFPGNYGLHGRPTLINSVETFADVPVIVQRGAQWWKDQGAGDSVGWKFFAVSGHVERPDVYCVPMGTTVRELIDLAGGVTGGAAVGAVQPGGASSNFIGPDQLDLRLDFGTAAEAGTMLGSGALVVLAEGTDLLAASTNVLRFFRDESCGKCVPCRVGSTKAHELLRDVLASGNSTLDEAQRGRILQLEEAMRKTSICGLGQVALGPVVSVLGLDKGGAAAREQPRPNGAAAQPDR